MRGVLVRSIGMGGIVMGAVTGVLTVAHCGAFTAEDSGSTDAAPPAVDAALEGSVSSDAAAIDGGRDGGRPKIGRAHV